MQHSPVELCCVWGAVLEPCVSSPPWVSPISDHKMPWHSAFITKLVHRVLGPPRVALVSTQDPRAVTTLGVQCSSRLISTDFHPSPPLWILPWSVAKHPAVATGHHSWSRGLKPIRIPTVVVSHLPFGCPTRQDLPQTSNQPFLSTFRHLCISWTFESTKGSFPQSSRWVTA